MKNTEKREKDGIQSKPSGEKGAEPLSRDEVLRLSSTTIRQLHRRVSGTVRFKEQASDGAKLSHIRALVAVLQVYGSILKDTEIGELDKRISELEREKESRSRS